MERSLELLKMKIGPEKLAVRSKKRWLVSGSGQVLLRGSVSTRTVLERLVSE